MEMENLGQMNPQEIRIQGLLDSYLASRAAEPPVSEFSDHLDDDSLAAFVEGNLSPREAGPMVSHLAGCSFCRHITAELVRLDLELSADEEIRPIAAANEEPAKISDVLSGLLSKIFGPRDGAVFAHHEADEEETGPENENGDKKD